MIRAPHLDALLRDPHVVKKMNRYPALWEVAGALALEVVRLQAQGEPVWLQQARTYYNSFSIRVRDGHRYQLRWWPEDPAALQVCVGGVRQRRLDDAEAVRGLFDELLAGGGVLAQAVSA